MANEPNVLVLGATGGSGLAFAREALASPNGPKVTLYVRNPSKLPSDLTSDLRVRVVQGDLTDAKALDDAMDGVTAVASFLGAYLSLQAFIWRDTTTPIADSFPTIFQAMRETGVKRIIALSTQAYALSEDQPSWAYWGWKWLPVIMAPQGNAEMKAIGERLAAQDDLDWTIIRVPHLNDGDATLPVHAGILGPDHMSSDLSRPSMGRWVLSELRESKWIKGAPLLCNI